LINSLNSFHSYIAYFYSLYFLSKSPIKSRERQSRETVCRDKGTTKETNSTKELAARAHHGDRTADNRRGLRRDNAAPSCAPTCTSPYPFPYPSTPTGHTSRGLKGYREGAGVQTPPLAISNELDKCCPIRGTRLRVRPTSHHNLLTQRGLPAAAASRLSMTCPRVRAGGAGVRPIRSIFSASYWKHTTYMLPPSRPISPRIIYMSAVLSLYTSYAWGVYA
jgi:hypothetical protein